MHRDKQRQRPVAERPAAASTAPGCRCNVDRTRNLSGGIAGEILDIIRHRVRANDGCVHRIADDDARRYVAIDVVGSGGSGVVIGSTSGHVDSQFAIERDFRGDGIAETEVAGAVVEVDRGTGCLLYTSDAADEYNPV